MKPKTQKKNAWVYVKFAIIIVVSGIFGAVCNMAIGAEFEDFTNLSAVLSRVFTGQGFRCWAAGCCWLRQPPACIGGEKTHGPGR